MLSSDKIFRNKYEKESGSLVEFEMFLIKSVKALNPTVVKTKIDDKIKQNSNDSVFTLLLLDYSRQNAYIIEQKTLNLKSPLIANECNRK